MRRPLNLTESDLEYVRGSDYFGIINYARHIRERTQFLEGADRRHWIAKYRQLEEMADAIKPQNLK
jgi:hypothetical protein